MKINPTRLAVIVLDKDSGKPLQGIPLQASVEKKNRLQIALGTLATDHTGYLSFSLKPLQPLEPPQPPGDDQPPAGFDLNTFLTTNEIRAVHLAPSASRIFP